MQKLHLPQSVKEVDCESKVEEARRLQEEEISITFELPDESEAQQQFKKGQTVAVLKSYLSTEFDLPMTSIKLMLGDVVLVDPYSLTDYPEMERFDAVRIVVKQTRK
ncbi:Aste57867_941 [Aphanomyces stellatus]|uniref:Aste57867_941 protein n=1 Tax=Aphanomyces stellatus TaxID=120398 RepID=A0A485K463_9STRA|nr:hypothetical protein As57867_000940 [Aphanomyces stellatus]VFT78164.1 Aste57867_941 [Aphanomyces stellatus]